METYGVSFEGFEPSCGWPSYNSWTEKIIPREKSELVRWGKILEDRQEGLATIKEAQWLIENAEEDLKYYRQIKADIAANGLETALKQSTRKVTPPQEES